MEIGNYTIEELQLELKRRKELESKESNTKNIVLFMYGKEGCEGYHKLQLTEDFSSLTVKDMDVIKSMSLRARFNSQRDIKILFIECELSVDQFYGTIDKFPDIFLNKACELNF